MDFCNSCIHNFHNLKQTRCLSVGEWINKLWYFQTMKQYSVLKGNELSSHTKIQRKLKCILRNESQHEKAANCMIPPILHSGKGKPTETLKRSVVNGVCVGEEMNRPIRGIYSSENTLYDILMMMKMDILLYICPNPWNVQQKVNLILQILSDYYVSIRFILGKKCTTLVVADIGRAMNVQDQQVCEKSPSLHQFIIILKLLTEK